MNIQVINSDLIAPFSGQFLGGRLLDVEQYSERLCFYYLGNGLGRPERFNLEFLTTLLVESEIFRREWLTLKKRMRKEIGRIQSEYWKRIQR